MLPPFNQYQLKGVVDQYLRMPGNINKHHSGGYHPAQGNAGHNHSMREIDGLMAQLDNSGFIGPFNWQDWSKNMPQGWETDINLLNNADVDTLRSLMTAHNRIDRTADGHLDGLFASGYIDKFFDRLAQLAP